MVLVVFPTAGGPLEAQHSPINVDLLPLPHLLVEDEDDEQRVYAERAEDVPPEGVELGVEWERVQPAAPHDVDYPADDGEDEGVEGELEER